MKTPVRNDEDSMVSMAENEQLERVSLDDKFVDEMNKSELQRKLKDLGIPVNNRALKHELQKLLSDLVTSGEAHRLRAIRKLRNTPARKSLKGNIFTASVGGSTSAASTNSVSSRASRSTGRKSYRRAQAIVQLESQPTSADENELENEYIMKNGNSRFIDKIEFSTQSIVSKQSLHDNEDLESNDMISKLNSNSTRNHMNDNSTESRSKLSNNIENQTNIESDINLKRQFHHQDDTIRNDELYNNDVLIRTNIPNISYENNVHQDREIEEDEEEEEEDDDEYVDARDSLPDGVAELVDSEDEQEEEDTYHHFSTSATYASGNMSEIETYDTISDDDNVGKDETDDTELKEYVTTHDHSMKEELDGNIDGDRLPSLVKNNINQVSATNKDISHQTSDSSKDNNIEHLNEERSDTYMISSTMTTTTSSLESSLLDRLQRVISGKELLSDSDFNQLVRLRASSSSCAANTGNHDDITNNEMDVVTENVTEGTPSTNHTIQMQTQQHHQDIQPYRQPNQITQTFDAGVTKSQVISEQNEINRAETVSESSTVTSTTELRESMEHAILTTKEESLPKGTTQYVNIQTAAVILFYSLIIFETTVGGGSLFGSSLISPAINLLLAPFRSVASIVTSPIQGQQPKPSTSSSTNSSHIDSQISNKISTSMSYVESGAVGHDDRRGPERDTIKIPSAAAGTLPSMEEIASRSRVGEITQTSASLQLDHVTQTPGAYSHRDTNSAGAEDPSRTFDSASSNVGATYPYFVDESMLSPDGEQTQMFPILPRRLGVSGSLSGPGSKLHDDIVEARKGLEDTPGAPDRCSSVIKTSVKDVSIGTDEMDVSREEKTVLGSRPATKYEGEAFGPKSYLWRSAVSDFSSGQPKDLLSPMSGRTSSVQDMGSDVLTKLHDALMGKDDRLSNASERRSSAGKRAFHATDWTKAEDRYAT